MISQTAKYALRAVVCLASHDETYLSRTDIAKVTRIPRDYLLKVLKDLDVAGIVKSRRGPGGGYQLTTVPRDLTSLDVVLAVDEIPRFKKCPLGFSKHAELCPLHRMLDEAAAALVEKLDATTIAELIPKRKSRHACNFPFVFQV